MGEGAGVGEGGGWGWGLGKKLLEESGGAGPSLLLERTGLALTRGENPGSGQEARDSVLGFGLFCHCPSGLNRWLPREYSDKG